MKFPVVCAVVASLLCAVTAVTYTTYTDNTCSTPVTSSGVDNPQVVSLNKCYKTNSGDYQKFHSCAVGGKAAMALYTDDGCTSKKAGSDNEFEIGKCLELVDGKGRKFTCDPASSLSVAFLAVFAAILTVCVF